MGYRKYIMVVGLTTLTQANAFASLETNNLAMLAFLAPRTVLARDIVFVGMVPEIRTNPPMYHYKVQTVPKPHC